MKTTEYSDIKNGGTGWSMDVITDDSMQPERGGLILKNVRHTGHNFAKDIRLVRIWMFVDVVDGSGEVTARKPYSVFLSASGAFTATKVQELRPVQVNLCGGTSRDVRSSAVDALNFETYFRKDANHLGYGFRVDYVGNKSGFANIENFEFERIDVSQIFLCSHYGLSPPHEPGGVLSAARFHPMVKYKLHPNPSYDTTKEHHRLTSLRFDYRFHLYLDALHTTVDAMPGTGNNAGLFRDKDEFPNPFRRPAKIVFDAAEKPVVIEVTAPGLAKGAPRLPSLDRCWDNVHWWGSGAGETIISAPGAFHAAHLHWRWGEVGKYAPLGYGNQAQFGPGGYPRILRDGFFGGYGVLVDPKIWIQTVRVAVVLNDKTLDPDQPNVKLEDLSTVDWRSLFENRRPTDTTAATNLRPIYPKDIWIPQDIVLWYSIEVHREVTVSNPEAFSPGSKGLAGSTFTTWTEGEGVEGVVFIHGFFFAHEPEQRLFIGSRTPEHWPTTASEIRQAKKWFRSARR